MKVDFLDQFDRYWTQTLRPRLAAVTDAEYLWEPFPNCLSIHKQADGSWQPDAGPSAPPGLEPLGTIAWRMEQMAAMLARRAESQFGADGLRPDTQGTAANALDRIDAAYADWRAGVDALVAEEDPPSSLIELIVYVHCELISQSAQVSLQRDLYRAKHLDRLRTRRPSAGRRRR